jgi:hypothetical protein
MEESRDCSRRGLIGLWIAKGIANAGFDEAAQVMAAARIKNKWGLLDIENPLQVAGQRLGEWLSDFPEIRQKSGGSAGKSADLFPRLTGNPACSTILGTRVRER